MTDNFNDENQGRHPPDRSQKMIDVFRAVIFDADDVGGEKHHQRARGGGVQIGGGGEESRQQESAREAYESETNKDPGAAASQAEVPLPEITFCPVFKPCGAMIYFFSPSA